MISEAALWRFSAMSIVATIPQTEAHQAESKHQQGRAAVRNSSGDRARDRIVAGNKPVRDIRRSRREHREEIGRCASTMRRCISVGIELCGVSATGHLQVRLTVTSCGEMEVGQEFTGYSTELIGPMDETRN